MVGKASQEVADVCYSHRDREAREAREEAHRQTRREQEERRRREEASRRADRRTPEKELVRA